MNRKEEAKRTAEARVLEHLKSWPNGATVRELSLEMGWPWQQMSKVLKRLALQDAVRIKDTQHKDARYRVHVVRRFAPLVTGSRLPACFELPCLATPTAGRVVRFNLDG